MSNRRKGQQQSHNQSSDSLNAYAKGELSLTRDPEDISKKKRKHDDLNHLYKEDYQPAKYSRAVEYFNARCYKKKLLSGDYKQLDLFEETKQLQAFGLGPYFYIEFMRRVMWLTLVMSILEGIRIYYDFMGKGVKGSSASFSTYLVSTTVGNYSGKVLTNFDNHIEVLVPAINYLCMLLFFWIWKGHYLATIKEYDDDRNEVSPEKFCVQIEGLEANFNSQDELAHFFSSFGPVYEISLIRRYKNKLSYFEDLVELDQEIKEEELEMILGSGDQQQINSLKKEREQLSNYISTLRIQPKVLSAFVHFQYEKSKVDMLTYFNNHYLFDSSLHSCMREACCCCVDSPQSKYLFHDKTLFVKTAQVPEPSQINWESFQVTGFSKFCRVILSAVIILLFLVVSCAIIGLCSIYISSNSINCQNVVIPETVSSASAMSNDQSKRCFCSANLLTSFSDNSIKEYCGYILNEIYIQQGIQYAITATSTIVNFLFGLVVDKLVRFTRPASNSTALVAKLTLYSIFMIFNTVLLPLLLYSNIYGFVPVSYASFLTLISKPLADVFNVKNLSFYVDFDSNWYKDVSPIFTNYMVLDTVITWVMFLLTKCLSQTDSLVEDENTILQKTMNEKITAFQLKIDKQYSAFCMIIFMLALYSPGIPVLLPLGFLCLFSKYVCNRSLLQNNSSRVDGLGPEFSSFTLVFMPVVLILGPLFGCRMLTGNLFLYPSALPFRLFQNITFSQEINRQLYLPFFIGLALLAAVEFFMYNTLIRFCSWLSSICYDKKVVIHPYHTLPFSEYAKTMSKMYSYNIRNNDRYKNVIINLEKHLIDGEDEK